MFHTRIRTNRTPRTRHVIRTVFLGGLVAAPLALTSCGGGSSGGAHASSGSLPSVIKIGQVDSFSGPLSSCAAAADGAKIAIDEANDKDMFGHDTRIELVRLDDRGTPKGAVTGFRKLVGQKVAGTIGPCGTPSAKAIVPQADARQMPLILNQPSAADLVKHEYVFRGGPPQVRVAGNTVKVLAAKGIKRVSIVYTNDYADTEAVWTEAWKTELKKQGISVAGVYPIPTNQPNISAVLERVRQDSPDAIGLDTFGAPTLSYAKQLRNAGMTQPLFGQIIMGYGFYNTTDTAARDGGSYYATSFLPTLDKPAVTTFVDRFKQSHDGQLPDPSAAQVYDGTTRLLKAIKSAHSVSPNAVRAALEGQRSIDGAQGHVRFISNGHDATADGFVMHVTRSGIHRQKIPE